MSLWMETLVAFRRVAYLDESLAKRVGGPDVVADARRRVESWDDMIERREKWERENPQKVVKA